MQVSYTADSIDLPDSSKELLESAVHDAAGSGLAIDVAGNVLMESSAESMGEVIGVAIAAVVLTVTFGSLVAAGLPLISALIGIGIAICTITNRNWFHRIGFEHNRPGNDAWARRGDRLFALHRLALSLRTT